MPAMPHIGVCWVCLVCLVYLLCWVAKDKGKLIALVFDDTWLFSIHNSKLTIQNCFFYLAPLPRRTILAVWKITIRSMRGVMFLI